MIIVKCPHCGKELKSMEVLVRSVALFQQQRIIQKHIKRDCNSKEVVHLTRKLDFPVVETIEDYKKLIKKENEKK